MSRIVDIEPLLKKYDGMNGGTEFSPIHFINDLMALEQLLSAQTCIEDYPTCTECEHYDSEKHYCPRFCQVIKDTLAEAQPSEDCISRQAVETFKEELIDKLAYTGYTEEYKNEIIDIINQMPSVYPKKPKGKWIITYPDGGRVFKCNQCNKYADIHYATDYCPNCGAKMEDNE